MNYYKEMLDESRMPLYSEGKHIFSEIVIDNEAAYYSTTSNIESDNVVEISKEEFDVINESIRLKPAQPEPTETELIQAELLLNQAEILAKQNEQDEVLAEILLNQMGV